MFPTVNRTISTSGQLGPLRKAVIATDRPGQRRGLEEEEVTSLTHTVWKWITKLKTQDTSEVCKPKCLFWQTQLI